MCVCVHYEKVLTDRIFHSTLEDHDLHSITLFLWALPLELKYFNYFHVANKSKLFKNSNIVNFLHKLSKAWMIPE